MKLHFFVKHNPTRKLLVIKENGKYDLPYITSNKNNVNTIIEHFNNNLNTHLDKDYFHLHNEEESNDYYYFCYYLATKKDAKKLISGEHMWYSDEEIVDIINNNNASEFLISYRNSLVNPLNEEEIYMMLDSNYKKDLIKELINDINAIKTNKISSLKKLPIGYLTEEEAKLIGKENEWKKIYLEVYSITTRCLPKRSKIDFFEEELKIQEKKEFTPKMFADMIRLYNGKTAKEAKDVLMKRKKK